MGIQIEFNPDLALREYGEREAPECVPGTLRVGRTYSFLKRGQRNYWFGGEIPLVITKGDQKLSRPIAAIRILEATHFLVGEEVYTRGKYFVNAVFDQSDPKINFEAFQRR
ncbi:hypothetical protein KA107_03435 [Candidatus Pacearchaeota archaeon]|nr:hypothetical protein [Candidatus Pacearchaeota archaeon]